MISVLASAGGWVHSLVDEKFRGREREKGVYGWEVGDRMCRRGM